MLFIVYYVITKFLIVQVSRHNVEIIDSVQEPRRPRSKEIQETVMRSHSQYLTLTY